MELLTEWELKGRTEGRTEERQELIVRQLTRKVGILPADIQAQIVALPPDTLLDVSEALLDFSSLDNLTDWLATVAGSPKGHHQPPPAQPTD